ncbi:Electron transfer flavoprotein beta-subunit [Acidilobus saccharovorans 345-15]|uniref:Electron transfer flavoprotein beta-subunit n=1 Tax=Acidilobus saccharovorans (strain DSM 16705 / JCM 18335 / VKM B-2471 / 345-15) TaxID=666510 RepID=D9Q306_ACIS3|nr:electron transfer flavoprotein subunit beta/FixA family protein [Acidilobus saccharovorans]ADL19694.1 Electron transfer flavoprotein beta-subunit [Acidilobus saccharovorans 345-15]
MGDIVVLLKPALNPEMIRGTPEGSVDFDYMPLKLSDIDRNAVEEAVRIRDQYLKGSKIYSISVATWGPVAKRDKDIKMAVQEGLAKGVDEAYIVEDDLITPGDQVTTASAIVAVLRKFNIKPDIILAGEATIDGFSGQVAGRVAAKLDLPYVSFARKIDIKGNTLVAERDVEDYVEVVEAPLPAVVSVTREINSPRPPTLIQIRMASRKPQHVVKLSDLSDVVTPKKKLSAARVLAVKRKQVMIEGKTLEETADKLIDALVSEGVIKA